MKGIIPNSIMANCGITKGRAGDTHTLTIDKQGEFQYVYGPYAEPRLEVTPGDIIQIETEDAFGGAITSEDDRPSQKLVFPFLNPQCGPIYVKGAEKGDCLAVAIHSVENRGGFGATCLIPEFGGLVGTGATALLNPPLPEVVRRVRVDRDWVYWNDALKLPYEPFIGTIGIAPEIEAISTLQPDYHGGNMDLPDVRPGNIIYFMVHSPGALLFVGDCHARQGDGEVTGVAIEQPATVVLQVDLIKDWRFTNPRLESSDSIMTIGSARPMEDAARIAYRDMVRWMQADYGFDELDAYMLLGQVGRMRLGNMVDPKYTMGASIEKRYIAGK